MNHQDLFIHLVSSGAIVRGLSDGRSPGMVIDTIAYAVIHAGAAATVPSTRTQEQLVDRAKEYLRWQFQVEHPDRETVEQPSWITAN